MKLVKTAVAAALLGTVFCVSAAEVHVAVAANFTAPAKELAPIFEKQTGHKLVLSFGATGMFYGQIKNGATYDVLLAADAKTPKKAIDEGYGVKDTSFTYAVGKLVLWSADANKVKDGKALLASGDFNKCAVANPKQKFVEGDNIGKTFNFVKTANADIGFVALSQVYKNGKITSGSGWIVPAELYGKIAQDAVLLKQGKNQDAAKEFLKFLQGPEAAKVKLDYGYGDK